MDASRIRVEVRNAEERAAVVALSGFLDASTVTALEDAIRKLVADGRPQIVLNFAGLQYISSSGVGLFMGSLAGIRESNGELRLAEVPAKVQKVFDLLGFSDLVPIHATEDEALAAFRARVAPLAPQVDVVFPVQVACGGCRATYTAPKVGMYRCRRCNEVFFVDSRAQVSVVRRGGTEPASHVKRIELRVPADVNYLQHLRRFVTGAASEEGFDEEKVNQIEMAFDEAITNVIEHAYNFDSAQAIEITLVSDADKLSIVLVDRGRAFQPQDAPLPDLKRHIAERKTGGLGRFLIQTLMDDVSFRQMDDGRNELTMTKYFRGRDASG